MFHDSECSDPKDKVFAALGIASRRDGTIPKYEVEYTQSVEEIIDTMVEVFGLASNQDDFPTCSDIDLVFGLKGALVMVPTEEERMCCKQRYIYYRSPFGTGGSGEEDEVAKRANAINR